MSRYRSRRRSSPLRTALTWGVVLGVSAWGTWRLVQFRGDFIADARQLSVPAQVDAEVPWRGAGQPTPTLPTLPTPDPPGAPPVLAVPLLDPEERAERIEHLLSGATLAFEGQRFLDARNALNQALGLLGESARADDVRLQLAALNEGVFLGPEYLPEDAHARLIDIAPGDTLPRLAQRYRIPQALLQALNPSLDPRKMRPGNGIKIVFGPFHLRYVKQARRMDLYARDMFVRSCQADIEVGYSLASGTYHVRSGGKVQHTGKLWVGFEGIDAENRDVRHGWLYGSAGPRGSNRDAVGLALRDSDLQTLYNVLVEGDSLLHVEP